jgi:hypothetical protein
MSDSALAFVPRTRRPGSGPGLFAVAAKMATAQRNAMCSVLLAPTVLFALVEPSARTESALSASIASKTRTRFTAAQPVRQLAWLRARRLAFLGAPMESTALTAVRRCKAPFAPGMGSVAAMAVATAMPTQVAPPVPQPARQRWSPANSEPVAVMVPVRASRINVPVCLAMVAQLVTASAPLPTARSVAAPLEACATQRQGLASVMATTSGKHAPPTVPAGPLEHNVEGTVLVIRKVHAFVINPPRLASSQAPVVSLARLGTFQPTANKDATRRAQALAMELSVSALRRSDLRTAAHGVPLTERLVSAVGTGLAKTVPRGVGSATVTRRGLALPAVPSAP